MTRTRLFRLGILWSAALLVAVAATARLRAQFVPPPLNSSPGAIGDGSTAGWYPTAAVFTKDGKQILILNGKGMTPAANMSNSGMERRLTGTISIVPAPDRVTLADYTRRVMSLSPYSDAIRLNPPAVPIGSPIPREVGGVSLARELARDRGSFSGHEYRRAHVGSRTRAPVVSLALVHTARDRVAVAMGRAVSR